MTNNYSATNRSPARLNPVQEYNNLHLTENFRSIMLVLKGVTGIYCIICVTNGRMYIGSAVDLSKRLAEHFLYGKTNEHLQRALNLYTLEHFKFQILEMCNIDVLLEREQFYLDWLFCQPENLRFNFCPNASTRLGATHSDQTRQKISDTLTGRSLSEETKAKMSESHKQTPHPFTGKVAQNAMKILLYSQDNILMEDFTSQILAAKRLGITPKTLRKYIGSPAIFKGKYIIKSD
jgi:group I intron endonuclease